MRRRQWLLLAILVGAAAIRLAVNDVSAFSPADEGTYIRTTQALRALGWGTYPGIVQTFIADTRLWVFPDPLRYGWYALTTIATSVQFRDGGRAIANLSTLAGILAVLLTWLLAREVVDENAALMAAALGITSPLQLGLGRRALQDETFCAAVLLALWCVARAAKSPTLLRYVAAVLALAFMLSVKESGLFLLPAALALVYAIKRKISVADVVTVVAASLLFFLGFVACARDAGAFFQIAQIVRVVQRAPYVVQFQNGPPHRLLVDLLALSPVVFVLAVAAIARREERVMVWPLAATLIAFAFLSKNLRFIVMVDPMMRIVAAPLVARHRAWLLVSAVTEWLLFQAVFVAADVYDPVTFQILQALRMIPR